MSNIITHGRNWTNKSGTITAGGAAQVLAAVNNDRYGFWIQNVSAADLWVSEQGNAAASQPSIKLAAGDMYEFPVAVGSALSIFGATTGQAFSAREW